MQVKISVKGKSVIVSTASTEIDNIIENVIDNHDTKTMQAILEDFERAVKERGKQ